MIFSKNILVIAKIFGALLATNIPKMMQNFWSVSVTFSEKVLDQAAQFHDSPPSAFAALLLNLCVLKGLYMD